MVSSWLVPDQAKLGLLLRLPMLHVMDTILLASDNSVVNLSVVDRVIFGPSNVTHENLEDMYEKLSGNAPSILLVLPHLLRLVCFFTIYLAAAFMLTLSAHQLIVVYVYSLLLAALPISLLAHHLLLMEEGQGYGHHWLVEAGIVDTGGTTLVRVITDVYVQVFMAFILSCLLSAHFEHSAESERRRNVLGSVLVLLLNAPIAAHFYWPALFYPIAAICLMPPLLMIVSTMTSVLRRGMQSVMHILRLKRQFLRHFGLYAFLEQEWVKMGVPTLLRTFWMTRLILLAVINANVILSPQESTKEWLNLLFDLARFLLTRGSETLLAILGLTSVISGGCHYVGVMVQRVLQSDDEEYLASASAVLFFVLSLQTGLTTLQPEKRFTRLCKNLCLLLTALFHFVHNMVNPVLLSMSAGGKFGRRVAEKHARALTLCLILVLAPSALTSVLWKHFDISTWLLAVTVFCVEVVVKVAVTLTIYLLYLYDHKCQKGTWEALDDAVYYVKAVGNSIEFCFAVFLFFNGAFILFFESGGTIRALTMIIHAYCNIWCEAKSGWATFMKRRTAASKINRLPKATKAELENHNDVCAICYQDMESATKTLCGHFFHSVCLRKWLYMQDTCPMCHAPLNEEQQKQEERGHQDRGLPNVLRYGARGRRQRAEEDDDDDVIEEDALGSQNSSDVSDDDDDTDDDDDDDDAIVAAAHQHPDLLEDEDDDDLISSLSSASPS